LQDLVVICKTNNIVKKYSMTQQLALPPGTYDLGAADLLSARVSESPRERILSTFRSPQNIAYLKDLFERQLSGSNNLKLREFAVSTLEDAVYSYESGEDILYSDSLAQRGKRKQTTSFWGEVRRLNLAFFEYRTQFLQDKASLISGHNTENFGHLDDEPYHLRMFTEDSLRPPGLKHLNGEGPLHGILETQTVDSREDALISSSMYGRREGFSSTGANTENSAPVGEAGTDPEDWCWDKGNPDRTPEQAISSYWGEGSVDSSTLGGNLHIDRYGRGNSWQENGGTRAMRYPTIPVWQKSGRRNYDQDIEETLGAGTRESSNHVRRWDISSVRDAPRT
jgi:hypothetical protein